MNKEELDKLTEALDGLGYEIIKLNYVEKETKWSWTARELELTLSLPKVKS